MISNIKLSEVKGENKKRIFNILGLNSESTEYSTRHTLSDGEYVLSGGALPMTEEEEYENISSLQYGKRKTLVVSTEGAIKSRNIDNPLVGIRLSGKYSDIKDSTKVVEDLGNGIKVVEYGEYPSFSVTEIQGQKFYEVNKEKTFLETGKTYWVPNLEVQLYRSSLIEPHVGYRARTHHAFQLFCNSAINPYFHDFPDNGKLEKYIEIKEYVDCEGNKYVEYDGLYYSVQPVRWYVDESEDYIVTTNTIAGGVPYGYHYYGEDEVILDEYSVDYFVKEMLVSDLIPSKVVDLPEKYVVEPVVEEAPVIEEQMQLPNLDNLSREQLIALQNQIAELLSKQNEESAYVPKLKK